MTQKLLIIERDTKEELRKAMIHNILEAKNMRLVSFSVLEQSRGHLIHENQHWYEAWCIIAVPEKTDEYYDDLTGMSE